MGAPEARVDFFVAGVGGVEEGVAVGVGGVFQDGFCPGDFAGLGGDESCGGAFALGGGHGVEGAHAFGGFEDGEVVVAEAGFFFEEVDVCFGGGHVGGVVASPVAFQFGVLAEAVFPFFLLAGFFDGGVGAGEEAAVGAAVDAGGLRDGGEEFGQCRGFFAGEVVGEVDVVFRCVLSGCCVVAAGGGLGVVARGGLAEVVLGVELCGGFRAVGGEVCGLGCGGACSGVFGGADGACGGGVVRVGRGVGGGGFCGVHGVSRWC